MRARPRDRSGASRIFKDCEPGAFAAPRARDGIDTFLDSTWSIAPDIYFEAAIHQALVHVSGSEFLKLMAKAAARPDQPSRVSA